MPRTKKGDAREREVARERKRKAERKRGHGEGCTVQTSTGLWRAAITLPNGRRQWISSKSRAEARRKFRDVSASVRQGLSLPAGKERLGPSLDRWLEAMQAERIRATPRARYRLGVETRIKPACGRVALTDPTPMKLQTFFTDIGRQGRSPRRTLAYPVTTQSPAALYGGTAPGAGRIPGNPVPSPTRPRWSTGLSRPSPPSRCRRSPARPTATRSRPSFRRRACYGCGSTTFGTARHRC